MKRRFVLVDESDEVIQAFKSRTPSSSLLNVDVVNDCVSFSSYSFAVHVFPLFVELAIGYVPSFFSQIRSSFHLPGAKLTLM